MLHGSTDTSLSSASASDSKQQDSAPSGKPKAPEEPKTDAYALIFSKLEALQKQLDQSVRTKPNEREREEFLEAVKSKNHKRMDELLLQFPILAHTHSEFKTDTSTFNTSVLGFAVHEGDSHSVNMLLQRKADPSAMIDYPRYTSPMLTDAISAAGHARTWNSESDKYNRICFLLINAKADLHARDNASGTAGGKDASETARFYRNGQVESYITKLRC